MNITATKNEALGERHINIVLDDHYLVTKCQPIKDFPNHLMTDEQRFGIILDAVLMTMGQEVSK